SSSSSSTLTKCQLPLTVEELNQTIPEDISVCDDFRNIELRHEDTSVCDDFSNIELRHVSHSQPQYHDLDNNYTYTNICDKYSQNHFGCQYHEEDYYDFDEGGNIGYTNISQENIPDLNTLGAYSENDHGGCSQDDDQNILFQDLCKKIVTKSRRKERFAKNWEFLVRLLADPRTNPELVSWVDSSKGTFRLMQPHVVVSLWNAKSNKSPISYHSFARGLRYHYKSGTLFLVAEHHLVYGCGPEALSYLQELLNKDSRTITDNR
ncbi:unnamed protein product, partial [Meganyctiphanes norvegica]